MNSKNEIQKYFVGNDVLSDLNHELQSLSPLKIFILVDANTHEFCLPMLLEHTSSLEEYELIEIEPGEGSKTAEIAVNLWSTLAELGADRKAILINLGGGVVTDLGGFVAATYKRGIDFWNVPTSLLAMVDAAIGGKTGVDVSGAKNLAGTFSQANLLCIYPPFLNTLPDEHLKSGFAEVFKHALIADKNYWQEAKDAWYNGAFESIIAKSVSIKQEVVRLDEKESGIRKTLNFGHTLGHAIESMFLEKGEDVFHGNAVAVGMLMAAKLSTQKAGLGDDDFKDVINTISSIYLKLEWPQEEDSRILHWLSFDKKNQNDNYRFALLTEIGKCVFDVPVETKEILEVLSWYRNEV